MKHLAFKYLLSVMLLFSSTWASAEDILPAKYSKQQMQALHARAYNLRRTKACLPLADSLLMMARATGYHQAEVDALNVKALYEFYRPNNEAAVECAFQAVLDKADEYGMTENYYQAVSNRALYDVREARYLEAIVFANKQMRLAEQRRSAIGIRNCYRLLGIIYQYRGQLAKATFFFEKAISYGLDKTLHHNPFYDYISLADCYRSMDDYRKILQTTAKARHYANEPNMHYNVAAYEAYAYFMLHDRDAFLRSYDEMERQHPQLDNLPSFVSQALKICKAIVDERYADAEQGMKTLKDKSDLEYMALKTAYAQWTGRYQESTQHMKQIIDNHYALNYFIFENDKQSRDRIFADQHIEQQRQALLNEKARIEGENARQQLYNTNLEIDNRQKATLKAQAQAQHDLLAANRQRLTENNLKEQLNQQTIEQENASEQLSAMRWLLIALGIAALLALVIAAIYYVRRKRINLKIAHANRLLNQSIKQLSAAQRHAKESELMKSRFIQNMSHEIRTPLSAILGFAEVLTQKNNMLTPQEKKDITKTITDNSNLLTNLVNDILDITSLESGEFDLKISAVGVNELCRDAFATTAPTKPDNVEMRINTSLPDTFTINTDPYRTKQVLLNMLTNAQKNTKHGMILLDCRFDPNSDTVSFVVTDTGCGVPIDKMKSIFQPYQKLDKDKQGNGLGLGICRIIASRLGGTIDIDRHYTRGARFWFTIPVKQ